MAVKAKARPKARKAAAPKRPAGILVRMQVFGNSSIDFKAKRGTLLGTFIKSNVPKGVDLSKFELRVDGRARANDYILNEGDEVQLAPNVAGGQQ